MNTYNTITTKKQHMTYILGVLISIAPMSVLTAIAVGIILYQIISFIRVFRLKCKTEKEMKIEMEASNRVQKMVDDMIANPDAYTDDQRSKCAQVLMSSLPSTKQEVHFKKILDIA